MAVTRRVPELHINYDNWPNGLNDPFELMDQTQSANEVAGNGSYTQGRVKTDAEMKAGLRQGRKLPGE